VDADVEASSQQTPGFGSPLDIVGLAIGAENGVARISG
jgi:hypothetical protein